MSHEFNDVLKELENWKAALVEAQEKQNSMFVVRLYARDAVLMSTLLVAPRVGYLAILDYFDNHFLNKHPVVVNVYDEKIQIFGDIAISSGLYEFHVDKVENNSYTFEDALGDTNGVKRSLLRARYTFVYKRISDSNWIIVTHHSSAAPEKDAGKLSAPQYYA